MSPSGSRKARILVVDDDRASRELMVKVLSQILGPDGQVIEPLADGSEAIVRAAVSPAAASPSTS